MNLFYKNFDEIKKENSENAASNAGETVENVSKKKLEIKFADIENIEINLEKNYMIISLIFHFNFLFIIIFLKSPYLYDCFKIRYKASP